VARREKKVKGLKRRGVLKVSREAATNGFCDIQRRVAGVSERLTASSKDMLSWHLRAIIDHHPCSLHAFCRDIPRFVHCHGRLSAVCHFEIATPLLIHDGFLIEATFDLGWPIPDQRTDRQDWLALLLSHLAAVSYFSDPLEFVFRIAGSSYRACHRLGTCLRVVSEQSAGF
jgi:hypothetical protein